MVWVWSELFDGFKDVVFRFSACILGDFWFLFFLFSSVSRLRLAIVFWVICLDGVW